MINSPVTPKINRWTNLTKRHTPADSSSFLSLLKGQCPYICWKSTCFRVKPLISLKIKTNNTAYFYNNLRQRYNTYINVSLHPVFSVCLSLSLSLFNKKREIHIEKDLNKKKIDLQQKNQVVSFCPNKIFTDQHNSLEYCCISIVSVFSGLRAYRRLFNVSNKEIPLPLFDGVNIWSYSHG
jgi:hypothetical protein